jgi:hypothetical protein
VQRTRLDSNGDISFYEDTGTTAKFFWDASAESLGIGTSSPATELHLAAVNPRIYAKAATTGYPYALFSNDGGDFYIGRDASGGGAFGKAYANVIWGTGANATVFATNNTERMRIDSSGRVGIGGTPNTNWRNDIADQEVLMLGTEATLYSDAGLTTALINNALINNADTFVNISQRGASQYFQYEGAHKWYTAASASAGSNINTEMTSPKMTLDVSGNLLVGTTSAGFVNDNGFSVESVNIVQRHINGTASGTAFTWFNYNGGAIGSITQSGTSGVAYNTSSDHRLKENVVELTGATTRLKQLEPKRFNFIADADTTVDGFLAHEVQTIVPEAITGTHNEVDADGNPVYQGIDQSKLVPLLVATIKELEARITALENA